MARGMWDTTEIYRSFVRYEAPWTKSGESVSFYGPYEGPQGKGQAKRRIKDQHGNVIEGKVQKLDIKVTDYLDEIGFHLEWVDVNE